MTAGHGIWTLCGDFGRDTMSAWNSHWEKDEEERRSGAIPPFCWCRCVARDVERKHWPSLD